jgi:hypothetical protein
MQHTELSLKQRGIMPTVLKSVVIMTFLALCLSSSIAQERAAQQGLRNRRRGATWRMRLRAV